MKIGILALQGGYEAHGRMLIKGARVNPGTFNPSRNTGTVCEPTLITTPHHLQQCAGLIIPGGESSTMLKLIHKNNLYDPLRAYIATNKPIFGTCAGAILLASVVSHPAQESFGCIDMAVQRNGYGRQLASKIVSGSCTLSTQPQEMVFIRAPRIIEIGPEVEVLAHCNDEPVCVQQGNYLAATFHPELSDNALWHDYFLSLVAKYSSAVK